MEPVFNSNPQSFLGMSLILRLHSKYIFVWLCIYVSSGIENTWDPNVILDLERRYLLNKAILRVSHAHFLAIKWPGIILSKTEYSHFQPVNWVFTQNPFFRSIVMLKNESLLLKLDGERLRDYHSRYFLTNV